MRRLIVVIALLLAAISTQVFADTENRTTLDEAKELAVKAAQIVRADGVATAGKQFEDKSQPWFGRGDTYVFLYGKDGTVYAHGAMPSLDGKNLIDLKDIHGKPLMRDICGVTGEQWVSYAWQNPKSGKVENKKSYVVQVGEYVVGVGAYDVN